MSLTTLGWLFTLGVLAHNTEEALFLPAWSLRAGRFHRPVTAPAFRAAAVLLSLLFVAITLASSLAGPDGFAAYLMTGYALAMVLNAFLPHVSVSLLMRRYMPGTATALSFNLPLGVWYLHRAFAMQRIHAPTFCWAGPVIVLALLALLPGLFAVGRKLHPAI